MRRRAATHAAILLRLMLSPSRVVLVCACVLTAGYSSLAGRQTAPAWPTAGWSTAAPADLGLDAQALESLHTEFAAGRHGYVDGMLVVRHGRIAFERSYAHDYAALFTGKGRPGIYNYYDPAWHPYYKRGALHTMQSVSKSVTSALIGIAILRGEIAGVDVKVMPYFSEFRIKPDPRRDRMRLIDVLTMRTGIGWDESSTSYTDATNNCAEMEASEDWIQYVLDQPMASDPGTVWVYNSGATQLLSYILKKATGMEADEYARERLFKPLGIESYWKRTPKGLADTEGGLYLTPRDLAKIGYLYLHDGVWAGTRLLPQGWAADSTRWIADAGKTGRGYGYKWWVLSRKGPTTVDAYAGIGYGGQRLIVAPELDLIAVFTGWNIYDKPEFGATLGLDRVLAAVKDMPRRTSGAGGDPVR
jgi:CubicO group peptidase (beta-lactamase class C family)